MSDNFSSQPPGPEEQRPQEPPQLLPVPEQQQWDTNYYLPIEDEEPYPESSADTAFPDAEKSGPKTSAILKEVAETLVLAVLIFFTVRGAIQNFKVEGSSMEPSLHNNQYLLVNKLSYASLDVDGVVDMVLRIPVAAASRLGIGEEEPAGNPTATAQDKRFFLFGQPSRGDIIVFRFPRDPSRDFIKRVVALPGERVEVKAGVVYVNGQRLDEPYILENPTYSRDSAVVPPNNYFVLGDNRNNSSDSHVWGPVPLENVVGRAWFTYWPWKEFGAIQAAVVSAIRP